MTVTVASFRQSFAEFADTLAYPDSMVTFWLGWAPSLISARAWQDLTDLGITLFVAHNLAIAGKNLKAGKTGGAPGQSSGPLQQKAVGQVSASYDTQAGAYTGAGWYNLTSYGVQLYSMIQMVGMGGIQVGAGFNPVPALGVWDNGNSLPPWTL